MIIVGIIVSIILFSIIVLVHEWGHFSTARLFGVRVEEFGLGITPRARKIFTDKKGTLYSLNWLPIGGFVKLTGEMPNTFLVYNEKKELYNNEDLELDIEAGKNIYDSKNNKISEDDKKIILFKLKENKASYNLMNKPAWQQAIIILAGVFMNFLLASLIFSVLFFIGIKPIGINTKIETELDLKLIPTYEQAIESGLLIKNEGLILSPVKGSIAEKAGIIDGDIVKGILESDGGILKINETNVLIEIIGKSGNKKLNLIINRNGTEKNIEIIPILGENETGNKGKIGAYIGDNIILNTNFEYKYGITDSIKSGVYETYNQSLLTFKGLGILIKKIFNPETPKEREEALSEVSGPIGIVDFVSNSLSAGITFLFILGAVISINLGVFNLLPIPALDGGRFLFITINGLIKRIFGKKAISDKTEGIIHVGFFMLLIALSIIIAYNDINKIISQ
ncbi:MAG: site-2 protease family protein [Candidatus Gracilibacteria bacterium]|nr:site-2 protease family protein [Candidatus Gracilibacteria bacterium]